MFGRYNITSGHNGLACWFENDILFGRLSHGGTQLSQCVALGLPCRLQLLLAARLSLHSIFINAISRLENIAVASILQLVDQLYDLFIQILLQLEKFFVQMHQFALPRLFVYIGDNIESKVENTLQVAWREVKQAADTASSSLEVPDVTQGRRQFNMSHAI